MLDREDIGLRERWFEQRLPKPVRLPGSLPAQGIGDEVTVDTQWTGGIVDRSWFTAPEYARYRAPGAVKVPFWLQPEKYYVGGAWYQRDISIPKAWEGHRIVLSLERPHWETRVWVDGAGFGTNRSLSTPHEYDLGALAPGRHALTIRVDNRLVVDVGRDSHSVSDHTQGNWNGIVGRIELRATPSVWLDDLQLYPSAAAGAVIVRGRVGNSTGRPGDGKVTFRVYSGSSSGEGQHAVDASVEIPVRWDAPGGSFEGRIQMDGVRVWDEFNPALYTAEARLQGAGGGDDTRTLRFGFRDWAAQGTQFTINGRKTFLRGTLECCIFPKTGHPPTDLDSWRRLIRVAKAHGLNNLRFHSWCPPEAAFQAGDELGMYFHVECASWPNASTTLGDGKPVDQWIYDEADRILRAYGNHPSFVLLLCGNEPGGAKHAQYLREWLTYVRSKDSRRLYSGGAGWPQLAENQFHVTPDPRVQAWGAGLKSRINASAPETGTDYRDYIAQRQEPVVSHEIGQWCVYPNFDEMKKYTGYLKPRNFEIFRETLAAHHLSAQARPFLLASGKLQTLCYKEDIEAALRTPGMGGFQLLDLHDFPGQGTALVGVLDPFWEEKGYVTPGEYRRFCGPTVPLARLAKRVFTQNEETVVGLEIAHFGPRPLEKVWPVFRLVNDQGKTVLRGDLPRQSVAIGNGQAPAEVRLDLSQLPAPARYKFTFGLARTPQGSDWICENDWDVWVYPPSLPEAAPTGVKVVHQFNAEALSTLEGGGKVLWLLPPQQVAPDKKLGPVALGFSSIFWNTAWTGRQAPHTLGVLCDPKHPLFADFPTDGHSNWQWWSLVTRAGAMILDDLPPGLLPTVQVIDDWVTARKLGLVFEARVGQGRLVVCSIDLERDLGADPVVRQFRHSLDRYMASDRFRPGVKVSPEVLAGLGVGGVAAQKPALSQ